MLLPRHGRAYRLFWDSYIRYIIRQDFHAFEHSLPQVPRSDRSILVLANHISWWDGFWVYDLNRRLFGRQFHVMMLEEQLRRHRFLQTAGAFSVAKGSRGILESLRYATELLAFPQNLLLLFPQGAIASQHTPHHALRWEKGAWRLLEAAHAHTQVLLCALHTDYGSQRKPTIFADTLLIDLQEITQPVHLQQAFVAHVESSRQKLLTRVG